MDAPALQHMVDKLTMMSANLDGNIDHSYNTQFYIRENYAIVRKGIRRTDETTVAIKTELYYRDHAPAVRASNIYLNCDCRAEN